VTKVKDTKSRALNETPSQSYRMSLAIWHSVTCQPTQVNTPLFKLTVFATNALLCSLYLVL